MKVHRTAKDYIELVKEDNCVHFGNCIYYLMRAIEEVNERVEQMEIAWAGLPGLQQLSKEPTPNLKPEQPHQDQPQNTIPVLSEYYGVFLEGLPPVAIFQYRDQAQDWAKNNYPLYHEIKLLDIGSIRPRQ